MKDEKSKVLLKEAVSEIRSLRRQNELMGARLGGFDDALLLLKAAPVYSGNGIMTEDLAWRIEKHLVAEEEKDDRRIP